MIFVRRVGGLRGGGRGGWDWIFVGGSGWWLHLLCWVVDWYMGFG